MFQTSTRTSFQGYEATVAYSKMNCAWRLFIKSFCLKTCPQAQLNQFNNLYQTNISQQVFRFRKFLIGVFQIISQDITKEKVIIWILSLCLKPLSRSSDTSYKLSFVLVYVYFRVMSFTSDKSPISCSLNFFLTNILVRHQCLTKNPHCS